MSSLHKGFTQCVPACLSTIALTFGAGATSAETIDKQQSHPDNWMLESIKMGSGHAQPDKRNAVVIAIIDDGIRKSHKDIEEFVWVNTKEVAGNGVDDDGNGFVDDIYGWDVADQNGAITPPEDRDDYYHGTHLAGIVTQIARAAYGARASDLVRVMPVKALADDADTAHIKSGYEGIEYAITMGADIVIAAWNVAHISPDEEQILERAAAAGMLVVASSGNFAEERDQYPAAYPTVLAVGSIEQNGEKTRESTYGQFVDISAPGSNIRSAGINSDDSYDVRSGTSFSTAIVATAAAMVKLHRPSLSWKEVEACLKESSLPIAVTQDEIKGKLGAGALQVDAAIECNFLFSQSADQNLHTRPKGFLRANRKRGSPMTWAIEPEGEFRGIRFYPVGDRKNSMDGKLEFRNEPAPDGSILASYALNNLPENIFVPGSRAYVSFEPQRKRKRADWLLEYEVETIDFSEIYCSGTTRIQSEGEISDGSGPKEYSANTDCKWLITAPPDKVIHFKFDEIDTESRTDMIYFFNGADTHEPIMAIFSGQELPPELSTWSNQVLVWFVASGENQGGGWSARYRFVDPLQ